MTTAEEAGKEGAQALREALGRHPLARYFFFATFLFLLWQTLRILSPFYVALLGAAILSFLVHPVHERVLRSLASRPNLAAGATTSAVALIVLLPVLLLGRISFRETTGLYPLFREKVAYARALSAEGGVREQLPPRAVALWDNVDPYLDAWNIDLKDLLLSSLESFSKDVAGVAAHLIKNAVLLAFNVAVLLFAMFFFLRDGPRVLHRLVELVPMDPVHKQAILDRLEVTLYAVVRGVLIVALVQGGLSGLGYLVFGVPFPVLLGVLTTLMSPIPIIGACGIWVPVAAGLFLTGSYQKALLVTVWSLVVVVGVDNLLRPVLISSKANLPLLLLFFGMLGGLKVYGASGILLGPVVIALVLTFINIYRAEYAEFLRPPVKGG